MQLSQLGDLSVYKNFNPMNLDSILFKDPALASQNYLYDQPSPDERYPISDNIIRMLTT